MARSGNGTSLGETFGYPICNSGEAAEDSRANHRCPFDKHGKPCTKSGTDDPLGVCSILVNRQPVIVCPRRFMGTPSIFSEAADFFFGPNATWVDLAEFKLTSADNLPVGNIDGVIVRYDEDNHIIDFGMVEIQSANISGSLREPFSTYTNRRDRNEAPLTEWPCPGVHPDYTSASIKRLIPQLQRKGHIFTTWGKKMAVVMQDMMLDRFPPLPAVPREEAQMVWLSYHLEYNSDQQTYNLVKHRAIYTTLDGAMEQLLKPSIPDEENFRRLLQQRFDKLVAGKGIQTSAHSLSSPVVTKRPMLVEPIPLPPTALRGLRILPIVNVTEGVAC